MKCPECGCLDNVRCYRTNTNGTWSRVDRLRRCTKCGTQFETEEKVKKIIKKPNTGRKKPKAVA